MGDQKDYVDYVDAPEFLDSQEQVELLDLRELQVKKVQMEDQEHLEQKELKEHQDHRVIQERWGKMVIKELMDQMEQTEDKETQGTIWHHLFQLDATMQGKNKPDGGELFPAKSCKDLKLCHPDIKSGSYFVDPNLGVQNDKFVVDCVFDGDRAETCIRPKTTIFTSKMDVVDTWKFLINDLNTNSEIAYDADAVALRYMRLNSMNVRQNITYKCRNQHAHRDTNGDEGRYVMIKTADGAEIDTDKNRNSMFMNVLKDECNQLDGKWHSAVFELKTSKLDSLPITDIKIRHTTKPTEFKVELGPICFS